MTRQASAEAIEDDAADKNVLESRQEAHDLELMTQPPIEIVTLSSTVEPVVSPRSSVSEVFSVSQGGPVDPARPQVTHMRWIRDLPLNVHTSQSTSSIDEMLLILEVQCVRYTELRDGNTKAFRCEGCPAKFRNRFEAAMHATRHLELPCPCEQCKDYEL